MSKKLAALISLIAVIAAVVFATATDGSVPEEDLPVLLVAFDKQSQVIREGQPLKELQIGMELRVGDKLVSKGISPMDIWVGRIATVRVRPGGELLVKAAIDNLRGVAGASGVELEVIQGAALSRVRLLDRNSHFRMSGVPVLTAARSTGYQVEVIKVGERARVTVGEGTVTVASSQDPNKTLEVKSGQSATLEPALPESASPDAAGTRKILADLAAMGLPPENVAPGTVSRLPEPALAFQHRELSLEQALWAVFDNLTGVMRPGATPAITEGGWANTDLLRASFTPIAGRSDFLYSPVLNVDRIDRLLRGEDDDSVRKLASYPLPVYSAVLFGTPQSNLGHPTLFHSYFDRDIKDSTRDVPRRGAPIWYRNGMGEATLLAKDGAIADMDLKGTKVVLITLSEGLIVVDLTSGSRTVIDRAWYPVFYSHHLSTTTISSSGKYVYYKTLDQKHRVVNAETGELVGEPEDPNLGFVSHYRFLDDHDLLWNSNLVFDPETKKSAKLEGHIRGMEPQGRGRDDWLRTADSIVQHHYDFRNQPAVYTRWSVAAIRAGLASGTIQPESVTLPSPPGEWDFRLYQFVPTANEPWVLHWATMEHWKLDEKLSLVTQDPYSQAMLLRVPGEPEGKVQLQLYEPATKTMGRKVAVKPTGEWGHILPGGAAFAWGSNTVGEGFVSVYTKAGRLLYQQDEGFGFLTNTSDRFAFVSGSLHFFGNPGVGIRAAAALDRLGGLWYLPLILALVAFFPEMRGWVSSRKPSDRTSPLDAILMLTGGRAASNATQQTTETVQRFECPGCRATLPTNFTQCSYCLVSLEGARTVSVPVSRPVASSAEPFSATHALVPILSLVILGAALWLVQATFGQFDSVAANVRIIPLFSGLVLGGAALTIIGAVIPLFRVSLGKKLGVLNLLGLGLVLIAWAMKFNPEMSAREVPMVPAAVLAVAVVAHFVLVRRADDSGRYR